MQENKSIRFSIRFDLNNESHTRAWDKLSKVKNGDKSEYCIRCILGAENLDDEIKKVIQETIHGALKEIQIIPVEKATEIKEEFEVPNEVNSFIDNFNDF